jgi:hypothetical protein
MDLHRRRSVLVWMTDTGQHLQTVRISWRMGSSGPVFEARPRPDMRRG